MDDEISIEAFPWSNDATATIAEWITTTPALAEHWSAVYLTTLRHGAAIARTDKLLAAELERAFQVSQDYGPDVTASTRKVVWLEVAEYIRLWDAD